MKQGTRLGHRSEAGFGRRGLLRIGSLGLLGLDLPRLFRAQAEAARRPERVRETRVNACIQIFYYGGPSHLDTFDMKPEAPADVRGEFQSIETSVPGLRICEHLPQTAKVMHHVAVIRSMHHQMRLHDSASFETLAGRTPIGGDRENIPDTPSTFPCYGSALNYLRRHERLVLPHAALPYVMNNDMKVPGQSGGFLGSRYDPFVIFGDPDTMSYQADILKPAQGMMPERLDRRKVLLRTLDSQASSVVPSKGNASMRVFYERAFDLLASKGVRRALDISREDRKTRERYGLGPREQGFIDDSKIPGGPQDGFARSLRGQNLLLARRLVEAGVPFVNVYDYKQQGLNWDSHARNFSLHKKHLLPAADQAFSALIEDLQERGLLETTLVVALGEFGRTPKINKNAGRDHWPDCYSAILAGGGVKGGLVYGASDKIAAYPDASPVTPGDLAATIFSRLGFNPETEIHDPTGRPWRLAEGKPIHRLFSG